MNCNESQRLSKLGLRRMRKEARQGKEKCFDMALWQMRCLWEEQECDQA